jgi:hypothetical protein
VLVSPNLAPCWKVSRTLDTFEIQFFTPSPDGTITLAARVHFESHKLCSHMVGMVEGK